MKPVVCFGCPPDERPAVDALLASLGLSASWVDDRPAILDTLRGDGNARPAILVLTPAALEAAAGARAEGSTVTAETGVVEASGAAARDDDRDRATAGVPVPPDEPGSGDEEWARPRPEWAEVGATLVSDGWGERAWDTVFAASKAMAETVEALGDVAAGAAREQPVVLTGQTGTGRRFLARCLHRASCPEGAPFEELDCGSLPGRALETALFGCPPADASGTGHVDGLETIAPAGCLHRAIGGTLLLSNLPTIGSRLQARLARLLRDGEARVAGAAGRPIELAVRLVVRSDGELRECIEDGRVRPELARYLAGPWIDVPPLAERVDDLPRLIERLLAEANAGETAGAAPTGITYPALRLLGALSYAENVPELRSVLDSLRRIARGRNIGLEDVLSCVRLDSRPRWPEAGTLRQARSRFERDYITAVLQQHGGNMSEAARALGIERTYLYRKLKALAT